MNAGEICSLAYQIRADQDFSGWLGNALVLMDGYVVNVSGRPLLTTDNDGYMISKDYGTGSCILNQPVRVRLQFESALETRFYVAVEDTLPPGFEADVASLEACVGEQVKSYSLRGDKVTFFITTLQDPMVLEYSMIPTLVGHMVAPPAKMFSMYMPDDVVFSGASELTVGEAVRDVNAENVDVTAGPKEPSMKKPAASSSSSPSGSPSSPAAPARPLAEQASEVVPLPDISLVSARMPQQARAGQTVVFIAGFSFSGFREDIMLRITAYVDGVPVKTESMLLSMTTTAFPFDFSWLVTPGTHIVRIAADPDDIIQEENEVNNVYTETFHIAAPQAAVHPQSSMWQAGFLALDGLLSFVATVWLYKPVGFLRRRKARKA